MLANGLQVSLSTDVKERMPIESIVLQVTVGYHMLDMQRPLELALSFNIPTQEFVMDPEVAFGIVARDPRLDFIRAITARLGTEVLSARLMLIVDRRAVQTIPTVFSQVGSHQPPMLFFWNDRGQPIINWPFQHRPNQWNIMQVRGAFVMTLR
jgi:hypothetical protein